jgi:transcriptional regulator with XRE-family HTH domain
MFYQRLHKICKEKGTTVTRMVKDIGLSSANLSNWKNGRLPKTEIAFKIANYLNVSIYDLMGEERSPMTLVHGGKEINESVNNVLDKVLNGGQATKKPSFKNEERLKELYNETADLSDAEIIALKAFVAGLKANRKPD